MRIRMSTATAIGLLALSVQSWAAQNATDLENWDTETLTGTWRATVMTDTPVYGESGEQIGEVENLIIGPDNKVRSIIVESGGFFDIGDTHIAVPWDRVDLAPDQEGIRVPVNQENVPDFDLFSGEDVEEGPRAWRATELLGDNVTFTDGSGYGIVYDLLFSEDGTLQAVVVNPSIGYSVGGHFAYPWRGYGEGFDPGDPNYDVGLARDDVMGLEPVDLDQIQSDVL